MSFLWGELKLAFMRFLVNAFYGVPNGGLLNSHYFSFLYKVWKGDAPSGWVDIDFGKMTKMVTMAALNGSVCFSFSVDGESWDDPIIVNSGEWVDVRMGARYARVKVFSASYYPVWFQLVAWYVTPRRWRR